MDGIAKAAVDFENEVLILVRHTEGSGSVGVAFKTPIVMLKTLVCKIERKEPEVRTADMAYYCFALAVSKSVVQEVVLEIAGREPLVLPFIEKKRSNKTDAGDGK